MTKQELARVLDLQNKAYNLLLWLDEQARHQSDLLSDENVAAWKYVESCEAWVRHMIGIFHATCARKIMTFQHFRI
jgi:hypothetical protein